MDYLSHLPTEILYLILEELDPIGVIYCSQTCHKLNTVSKTSHLYEYSTSLLLAGLEDGPNRGSTATRLRQLQRYQEAWNTLRWTSSEIYDITESASWELIAGVLGIYIPGTGFRFTRLPSGIRGIEKKEWTVIMNLADSESIEDFTFDPFQHLLVVLKRKTDRSKSSIYAHFLRLDDGEYHPSAKKPTICLYDGVDAEMDWEYEVRICEMRLGILFAPLDEDVEDEIWSNLRVWNWREGEETRHFKNIVAFSFLTDRLLLYSTPSMPLKAAALSVDDLEERHECLILRLGLPKVGEENDDAYDIHSETLPSVQSSPQDTPFNISRRNRVLVVSSPDWEGRSSDTLLFVRLDTILEHVQLAIHQPSDLHPRFVPWISWGPSGTRAIPSVLPDQWVCYMNGLRAVLLDESSFQFEGSDESNHPNALVHVFDFNPLPVQQKGIVKVDIPSKMAYSAGDELLANTTAPYSKVAGHFPVSYPTGIMLTDDAIVMVTSDETKLVVYSF